MTHGSAEEQRRAAVTRSNQRFGAVLSIIGGLLALAAAVVVYVAGAAASGDGYRAGDLARNSLVTVGVLIFFALCLLIPGEQMRRGSIRRNPAPPDTMLPSATRTSSFRVLSPMWRVVWIVIALAVAASLLVPVLVGFTAGTWPHSLDAHEAVEVLWSVYGSVAFAAGLTCASSLVKLLITTRRRKTEQRSQPGWRFWLYRWRLDVWLVAVGGFFASMCVVFEASAAAELDSSATAPPFLLFALVAVIVAAAGFVLGTQFWRTGEQLGSGESYA